VTPPSAAASCYRQRRIWIVGGQIVWSANEIAKVVSSTLDCAQGVSADHSGGRATITRWSFWQENLPPSIASGSGRPTEALMFMCEAAFTTSVEPQRISRSRNLSWHRPGTDDHGGVEVTFTSSRRGGSTEVSVGSRLHVGNAIGPGWGVFSNGRDRKMLNLIADVHRLMESQPVAGHHCDWDVIPGMVR